MISTPVHLSFLVAPIGFVGGLRKPSAFLIIASEVGLLDPAVPNRADVGTVWGLYFDVIKKTGHTICKVGSPQGFSVCSDPGSTDASTWARL
jgi:hypothetical protein